MRTFAFSRPVRHDRREVRRRAPGVPGGRIRVMDDTRTESEPASGILAKPWYWYYVLGLLFLSYVLNTVDRNSVLSLLLEDIKKEFGASDAQLGLLGGIPFA